jgi:hypothetical protein
LANSESLAVIDILTAYIGESEDAYIISLGLVVRASSSRWSFFLFPYVEYFDSY